MTDPLAPPTEVVSFSEQQSFRSNRLAMLCGVAAALGCGGATLALFTEAGSGVAPLLSLLILGAVSALLLLGELRVHVRPSGLWLRLVPLTRQHRFAWSEIRSCEARRYRPILEYGGWGIRWGRSGKAYNVHGNRGVQLVFQDGKRLLIGSQRADQLAAAIRAELDR